MSVVAPRILDVGRIVLNLIPLHLSRFDIKEMSLIGVWLCFESSAGSAATTFGSFSHLKGGNA